ncbi:MAG: DUF1580 domain-containing protein [Planctomycetes bacterium]|nr:DUF1580 domain-containing protein [Planctomycetota bacterium]
MQKKSYISLSQATKLSPGRPHTSAIWRWCRKGLQSRSGEVIRLKHIRAGGRIYTTPNWLSQFFDAVTESDITQFKNITPIKYTRTKRKQQNRNKRQQEIYRAKAELEKAGI